MTEWMAAFFVVFYTCVAGALKEALESSSGYPAPELITAIAQAAGVDAQVLSTFEVIKFYVLYGWCAGLYVLCKILKFKK